MKPSTLPAMMIVDSVTAKERVPSQSRGLIWSARFCYFAAVLTAIWLAWSWLQRHDQSIRDEFKPVPNVIQPTLPLSLAPLCPDGIWIAHRVDRWKKSNESWTPYKIARSDWRRICV
jgi:hypothetical protein